MTILLYQLVIIGTLGLTRILAPRWLLRACLIWTALTLFNVFWLPLIFIQLIVIWITFALLESSSSKAEKRTLSSEQSNSGSSDDATGALPSALGELNPAPAMAPVQPLTKPNFRIEENPARLNFGKIIGNFPPAIDLNTNREYIEQQVKAHTDSMLSSYALEKHHIVRMVERAEKTLQSEIRRSKDKHYEEAYTKYDALLRGAPLPPRQIDCTDFSRRFGHLIQAVETVIQSKYETTTSEYSAFLKETLQRLQRRQGLRDLFEKLMLSTGGSEVLKRIKCFEAGHEWRYAASIREATFTQSQPFTNTSQALERERSSSPITKPQAKGALAPLELPAFVQERHLPPDYSNQEIQQTAITLQLPSLVHFTRACNLESILKHGLCSITKASELGITPHINDSLRLDGHLGAISISIAFPNHKMFYSYRQKEPDEEWAVLIIDPDILGRKNCAFCQRNAADHRIRQLPLSSLMNADAFRDMFEEVNGISSRQEQQLMAYDPTDPQAEVLVFQTIEPEHIGGIAFDSDNALNAYSHLLGDRKWQVFKKNTGLFGSRGFARK